MDIITSFFVSLLVAVTALFSPPVVAEPILVETDESTVLDATADTEQPVVDGVTATVLEVIDGDSIIVEIAGKREFVRYIGIDTPEYEEEVSECFATEATKANQDLVASRNVTLVADEENRDKYNRLLRYVYVDDRFVNAELVRQGFARAKYYYPNDQHRVELEALESVAQKSAIGLWGNCPTEQLH